MNQIMFADRIKEERNEAYHLLMLPGTAREFVTWNGSFEVKPDFSQGDDIIQDMIVAMLDKGTTQRDLFGISDFLEQRGARTQFSNRGIRIGFSGKCLKEDLQDVLLLQFEQLRDSIFDPEQLEFVRNRLVGSVQRSREQTAATAAGALSRLMYPASHPNYVPQPEEEINWLQSFSRDQLLAYYKEQYCNSALRLAITGDFEPETVMQALEEGINGWERGASFVPVPVIEPAAASEESVHMEGKMNTDVRFGHAIPIYRGDPRFYALMTGVHILGGNFSSRLMRTVRDEQGLTYGIRSGLVGFSDHYSGHFRIQVTLSQENLEKGIAMTREEVKKMVENGCTEQELSTHQETLKGDFKVGLATTDGLAGSMLRGMEWGRGGHYLDEYPQQITDLQQEQVNDVLRTLCKPALLIETRAGHLTEA